MKKPKVVLNLKALSISDKLELARAVVKALTGNPDFEKPLPTLTEVTAGTDALDKAYTDARALRQSASSATALQYQLEEALDMLLTALGAYVEAMSKGDEAKIRSAGFSVRPPSAPLGLVALPLSLVATPGVMKGTITLKWRSVRGAAAYVVQITTDINDTESWKQVAIVTKTRALAEGLQPGVQYWFQVAATGASGQGPWSDPATRMAP